MSCQLVVTDASQNCNTFETFTSRHGIISQGKNFQFLGLKQVVPIVTSMFDLLTNISVSYIKKQCVEASCKHVSTALLFILKIHKMYITYVLGKKPPI